jgi:hypothetical protein
MDQSICKRRLRPAPIQRTERTMSGTNGETPLKASAELMRTYSAVVNAITANVLNAQAGFEWLSAEPPNLEEVRRSLNSIANDGKRTGEVIVRLRSLMERVPTEDGVPGP